MLHVVILPCVLVLHVVNLTCVLGVVWCGLEYLNNCSESCVLGVAFCNLDLSA